MCDVQYLLCMEVLSWLWFMSQGLIFWGQYRVLAGTQWSTERVLQMLYHVIFSFYPLKCALDACYMPAFYLVPLRLNCAGLPLLWLGCLLALFSLQPLLVTLSKQIKGHMIRRGRTLGPIQQPGPIAYNTWAQRNAEKKTERKEKRKSFGPSVCLDKSLESSGKVFS